MAQFYTFFLCSYLHHGWRKFWNLMFWDAIEWRSSTLFFYIHTFTMVEENVEIRRSEMLQNGSILYIPFIFIPSPWLKNFLNLTFWNAPDSLNITTFWQSIITQRSTIDMLLDFTMVEENFEIWLSETLQIDSILLLAEKCVKCCLTVFAKCEKRLPYLIVMLRLPPPLWNFCLPYAHIVRLPPPLFTVPPV